MLSKWVTVLGVHEQCRCESTTSEPLETGIPRDKPKGDKVLSPSSANINQREGMGWMVVATHLSPNVAISLILASGSSTHTANLDTTDTKRQ